MKYHTFVATQVGFDENKDIVWFSEDQYTKEEAIAQFVPSTEEVNKYGHYVPYTFLHI